ncbi:MAG: thiol:disulfide interchange protein DsbA/DsbL [Pseudomonadota bacterium]
MKNLLTRLTLAAALVLAQHTAFALDAGKDYQELSPAQAVETKRGQIEILEFFWYRCPHCFELEPELSAWAKKQAKDVVIRRVPGILNPGWAALARAYYALEAIGQAERLHGDVFNAIHVQGMDLNPPERFFDWAVTKGVDRKQIADAYNSFAVNTKVMRAQQMTAAYKLNGVPAFAVNGKYVTSAYMAGSVPAAFKVLDELIAQERKKAGRK